MKRFIYFLIAQTAIVSILLQGSVFAEVYQDAAERAAINGALEWVEQQYNVGNYYESGYKVGEIMSWTLTDEQRSRAQSLQGKIAQSLQELDWEKIDQYIDDAEWQYKKGYTYEPLAQLNQALSWNLRQDQKSRISNLRDEINDKLYSREHWAEIYAKWYNKEYAEPAKSWPVEWLYELEPIEGSI